MPLSEPLLDIQVYDAINEETELPNITYPDSDEAKSIIEFHACEFIIPRCVYNICFCFYESQQKQQAVYKLSHL